MLEEDQKIDAFLDEVEELSKKHGLSISHSDHYGNFVVEPFKEINITWLKQATKDLTDD